MTKQRHVVKCKICGKSFDLNSEQGVRVGTTRYAHQACFPEGKPVPMETESEPEPKKEELKEKKEEKEEKVAAAHEPPPADPIKESLNSLRDYINEKYRETANWPLIQKQINKFHAPPYNYSYSGMEKTLRYFYDIQHNNYLSSNGGIGIVEYTFNQARDYYQKIYEAQKANEQKVFIHQVKEYIIKPPKEKNICRQISWGDNDEN